VVVPCRRVDAAAAGREDVVSDYPGASLTGPGGPLVGPGVRRPGGRRPRSNRCLLQQRQGDGDPAPGDGDGFEQRFGVNHLGHFALTGLRFDLLRAAPDPRVVTHSSGAHARGVIDFEDLHGAEDYDEWAAYARSTLASWTGGVLNARGPPEIQRSAGRSDDERTATQLWRVSVEETGVEYP